MKQLPQKFAHIGMLLQDMPALPATDIDRALQHYEAALAISRDIGDQWGVATHLSNIGSIYHGQRDLKRARYDFLLAALRLKASSGALTEEDIAGINALLDKAEPITVPDVNAPVRGPSSSVPPAQPPARTSARDGTTSTPPSSAPTPAPAAKPTSTTAPKSARTKPAKRV